EQAVVLWQPPSVVSPVGGALCINRIRWFVVMAASIRPRTSRRFEFGRCRGLCRAGDLFVVCRPVRCCKRNSIFVPGTYWGSRHGGCLLLAFLQRFGFAWTVPARDCAEFDSDWVAG